MAHRPTTGNTVAIDRFNPNGPSGYAPVYSDGSHGPTYATRDEAEADYAKATRTLSPELRSAIIAEARACRAHRKASRTVGADSVGAWRTLMDRAEDTGRIMRRDYPDYVERGAMWQRVFRITYMRG